MASSASNTIEDSALVRVDCPRCKISVVRLQSNSKSNPGRIFYKCPNNIQGDQTCNFFKWEDEYKLYLARLGLRQEEGSGFRSELTSDMKKLPTEVKNNPIAKSVISDKKDISEMLEICQILGQIKMIIVVGFAVLISMLAVVVAMLWK